MAFINVSYEYDVKKYFKSCSTKRLTKIYNDLWSMLLERDDAAMERHAMKAAKKGNTTSESKAKRATKQA